MNDQPVGHSRRPDHASPALDRAEQASATGIVCMLPQKFHSSGDKQRKSFAGVRRSGERRLTLGKERELLSSLGFVHPRVDEAGKPGGISWHGGTS